MSERDRDWSAFALVLIDAQRDFWTQPVAQAFPDFPKNVARLLSFCRREGIEVIHVRARYKTDGSDWMLRYRLRGTIPCIEGTPGIETLPCAAETDGETVWIKRTFDVFQDPAFLRYLKERRKRFLLTAGLVTSTCVLLTTASAMQNGLLTAVVEDCCADLPAAHAQTLDYYDFIFDRCPVEALGERFPEWQEAIARAAAIPRLS